MLASSVFHPGHLVPRLESAAATGGESGFIPNPGAGSGGSDGGTIPPGGYPPGGTNPPGGQNPPEGNHPPGGNPGTLPPTAGNPPGGNPLPGDGGAVSGGHTPPGGGDGGTVPDGTPSGGNDGGGVDIDLPRVCTWHWEPMFFEEAQRPLLTVETFELAASDVACPAEWGALCQMIRPSKDGVDWMQPAAFGHRPGVPSMRLIALDLTGRDMRDERYRRRVRLDYTQLRAVGGDRWRDISARAQVCDDRERSGSCAEKAWDRIVSVANVDFRVGALPPELRVEIFSGRIPYTPSYYDDLPEWCEQLISPLVLDLAGNGVALSSPRDGVRFDLEASGQAVLTGWTAGGDDAFLVLDANGDGRIDSGAELFGSATRLANGDRAVNGFAALAERDSNGDGKITAADASWNDLRLWVDSNHDGESSANELHRLEAADVREISLAYVEASETDEFGNQTRQRSVFRRGDRSQLVVDAWFRTLSGH